MVATVTACVDGSLDGIAESISRATGVGDEHLGQGQWQGHTAQEDLPLGCLGGAVHETSVM